MKLDGQAPVRALMTTSVVSLTPSHRVWEARELFETCGLHHLPVIDDERHLVGIVCHTDLYRVGLEAADAHGDRPAPEGARKVPIARIMHRHPPTILPDAPLERAVGMLAEGRFHALTVVDDADRVVGILTTGDILRRLLGH